MCSLRHNVIKKNGKENNTGSKKMTRNITQAIRETSKQEVQDNYKNASIEIGGADWKMWAITHYTGNTSINKIVNITEEVVESLLDEYQSAASK